jgi:CheY-like chemotaxis protein
MNIKHVLLIDDNAIDNYIAKTVISKSGLVEKISVMISAIDALEYLELLKSNSEQFPDVIFLDIQMPEMDGFGFLEEFSEFPTNVTNKSVVFMLTSSSDPADINRSTEYPAVKKYFSKPMTENIIKEVSANGFL